MANSQFDALIADKDVLIFDFFGVPATYTDTQNTVTSCMAIVDENIELIDNGYGSVVNKTTGISLRRSDIDNPGRGDTITMDGTVYLVEEELSRDNTLVTVAVRRGN